MNEPRLSAASARPEYRSGYKYDTYKCVLIYRNLSAPSLLLNSHSQTQACFIRSSLQSQNIYFCHVRQ